MTTSGGGALGGETGQNPLGVGGTRVRSLRQERMLRMKTPAAVAWWHKSGVPGKLVSSG